MSDENTESLAIDLSDQTTLRFSGPNEVANWINKEQQAFKWLQESGSRAGGGTQNLASLYYNAFNNMRQALNAWTGNVKQANFKQQLASHIQGFYSQNLAVRSDHQFARIANAIATKDGGIAAAAAFGFLLGQDCELTFETFKGLLSAQFFRDGITSSSSQLVANAVADINSAAKAQMNSTASEWEAFAAGCRGQLKTADDEFKKRAADFSNATDQTFARVNESVDTALKSIRQTEETYKEQMKLRAPVEYWQAKAERHAEALRKSRWTLILFASLGGSALVSILLYVTNHAFSVAENSNAQTAVLLKYAAISAVVTTIAFWVARILVRIYLSDRHLLTDAEERIALIKTYLALSNDSKVEATDRALILAPLFRTAADGIVKEEGPDASIAGMIVKALDLRGKS